jgi:heme-degrading monooxygenase HmoA
MFIVIWEFYARRGRESEFEQAYGPSGLWAQFFRRSPDYKGTTLLGDTTGRYLTLDHWISREAYDAFRKTNAVEYESIDRECETLTEQETPIGSFQTVSK